MWQDVSDQCIADLFCQRKNLENQSVFFAIIAKKLAGLLFLNSCLYTCIWCHCLVNKLLVGVFLTRPKWLQWSRGNTGDCSMWGPRTESHRGQLYVYRRKSLWYAAFGTDCTLPAVPGSAQLSTLSGTVEWLPAFGLSYNNRMETVGVNDSSLSLYHSCDSTAIRRHHGAFDYDESDQNYDLHLIQLRWKIDVDFLLASNGSRHAQYIVVWS